MRRKKSQLSLFQLPSLFSLSSLFFPSFLSCMGGYEENLPSFPSLLFLFSPPPSFLPSPIFPSSGTGRCRKGKELYVKEEKRIAFIPPPFPPLFPLFRSGNARRRDEGKEKGKLSLASPFPPFLFPFPSPQGRMVEGR